jgi:hypothetical protein
VLADAAARGWEELVSRLGDAITAIDTSRGELGRAPRLLKARTRSLQCDR